MAVQPYLVGYAGAIQDQALWLRVATLVYVTQLAVACGPLLLPASNPPGWDRSAIGDSSLAGGPLQSIGGACPQWAANYGKG